MATVGGVTCSKVSGHPRPQQERVEVFDIPGRDGTGIQLYGKGDGQWQGELVFYGTGSAVDAWYVSICALQGTLVTVVNDWDTTALNQLVANVSQLRKTVAIGEGGSRGACVVLFQDHSEA